MEKTSKFHTAPASRRNRLARVIGGGSLAAFTLFGAALAHATPPEKPWKEGRILVKARAGLPVAELEKTLNKQGGKSLGLLKALGIHMVEVPRQAEKVIARALSRDPHIKFAELDMLLELSETLPNDPNYPNAWHLPKMQTPLAWDSSRGDGVIVAILDTGVDPDHPDLVGQLLPGTNTVSNNTDTSDIFGHGTKVAGVVAATSNNGSGVASIAWNAQLMPIRISNDSSSGTAYTSDIAEGITWAADHGADVANISYAASGSSTVSNAASYMRNKGGIVVVAAGNAGTDPGYSDKTEMIAVSATTSSDAKASWSNYGNFIDVAAPGVGIWTTTNGGGYGAPSGTSFASPATAGVVALIMSANPTLSADEVESILEQSADDPAGTDWHQYYGYGRVNAAAAVEMALNTGTPPVDSETPTVNIFSPDPGSTVSDLLPIEVNATDNVRVTEVALYAGNNLVGVDSSEPYQFIWDSTAVADGYVTLTAYAYDAANNEGRADITVTVQNENFYFITDTTPPSVTVTNPADGGTVKRTVNISANASDDTGVTSLSLYIDEALYCSTDTATLSCGWNTSKVDSGNHAIKAVAQDAAGNSKEMLIHVNVAGKNKRRKK